MESNDILLEGSVNDELDSSETFGTAKSQMACTPARAASPITHGPQATGIDVTTLEQPDDAVPSEAASEELAQGGEPVEPVSPVRVAIGA